MTSLPPYDVHLGIVINDAKFDICTPNSFGGVKTDTHIDNIVLYITDEIFCHMYFCPPSQKSFFSVKLEHGCLKTSFGVTDTADSATIKGKLP